MLMETWEIEIRRRDRVNGLARIQQKNWRLKNLKKARARDKRYYEAKKRLTLEKRKTIIEIKDHSIQGNGTLKPWVFQDPLG